MHESTLARGILSIVVDHAHRRGASRVLVARGWVAETERIDPVGLAMHFQSQAVGTIAHGARLEVTPVHVEARCACGCVFAPEHHVLLCPSCGKVDDAQVLGETGLGVSSIDVE